jgi:plastocyanin
MSLARMSLLSLLLVLGCGGGSGPSSPPPSPNPPPPPPPAGSNTVAVTSNLFNPQAITVARNATVTWNFQSPGHNVTFEDGVGNSAGDVSSGTHTRSFATAATYRYRCTNHSTSFTSGMTGSVVVQ